jgi:Asp-tRNA(Asn)/Glu-tRNA(Gln) amidotransferase C subunit
MGKVVKFPKVAELDPLALLESSLKDMCSRMERAAGIVKELADLDTQSCKPASELIRKARQYVLETKTWEVGVR